MGRKSLPTELLARLTTAFIKCHSATCRRAGLFARDGTGLGHGYPTRTLKHALTCTGVSAPGRIRTCDTGFTSRSFLMVLPGYR